VNTISCLIVDDEPNAVQLLEDHIRKVPQLVLKQKCYDAFEALRFLQSDKADLLFLDIQMPGLSGMELASFLHKEQRIIFTTAYANYALEGYEYNAVDYLLKPITFKRFAQAVNKAMLTFPVVHTVSPVEENDYIFIKSGKEIIKLAYHQILFIEALKEYVNIVLPDGKVLAYKRMKDLEEQLPDNFLRIHNSYIVNIDHLEKIVDNHVLIGKERLPVSASCKAQLLAVISRRLL
jgi:two-component system, LytTR family, response regulator